MGSDGVSEVGAGAGERTGRMVNETQFCIGLYCRAGSMWGWRLVSTMSLWRLGGFFEGDRGGV